MNLIDIRTAFKTFFTIFLISCLKLLFSSSMLKANSTLEFDSRGEVIYLFYDQEELPLTTQREIKVPELVTPNGDGKNDSWEIIGIENYTNTKVMVFNRWGNKVFEMDQYDNSWEGEANGNLVVGDSKLPAGTYYYIVELDGEVLKGFLFLAR